MTEQLHLLAQANTEGISTEEQDSRAVDKNMEGSEEVTKNHEVNQIQNDLFHKTL